MVSDGGDNEVYCDTFLGFHFLTGKKESNYKVDPVTKGIRSKVIQSYSKALGRGWQHQGSGAVGLYTSNS